MPACRQHIDSTGRRRWRIRDRLRTSQRRHPAGLMVRILALGISPANVSHRVHRMHGGSPQKLRLAALVPREGTSHIANLPLLSAPVQRTIEKRHESAVYGNHVGSAGVRELPFAAPRRRSARPPAASRRRMASAVRAIGFQLAEFSQPARPRCMHPDRRRLEHCVHVAICVQKSVATAEQLRPFRPEIANGRQFDLARMLRFVASQGNGVSDLGMFTATDQSQTNHESRSAGETNAVACCFSTGVEVPRIRCSDAPTAIVSPAKHRTVMR